MVPADDILQDMLQEKMGYRFFDDELLSLAAQKAGFSEAIIRQFDEKPGNSLLYSTFVNSAATARCAAAQSKAGHGPI